MPMKREKDEVDGMAKNYYRFPDRERPMKQ
jgi:hypothetical protein